jgi:3-phosphoshikimate 1-carboxyvinyltransferase
MTARALVLAALSDAPSTITGALAARDTTLMTGALTALGVVISNQDGDALNVVPGPLQGPAYVDCGLAGTVMRFVPAVASLAEGDIRFDGDPRARVRPMKQVIDSLEQLGAQVDDDGRGRLPFTVSGRGGIPGGQVRLDSSSSSQFVSALLLSGARFERGVRVRHTGKPVPSRPHLSMTITMLGEHGVDVVEEVEDPRDCSWTVAPGPIRALDRQVEPDLSNAAPFLAAAAVTGGKVTIARWPERTTQPGQYFPELLTAMGASVQCGAHGLTLTGPDRLAGLEADLHDLGELTPVLAAVCALATTPSRLRGIAHLRGHETDRLRALATELSGMGADVEETDDGLTITPKPLHGTVFQTYDDHRMATAAAVLGLVVPDVRVVDVATTAKTLPKFTRMWSEMLGDRDAAA